MKSISFLLNGVQRNLTVDETRMLLWVLRDDLEAQRSDVPHDTAHPLYRLGFGLRYTIKRR